MLQKALVTLYAGRQASSVALFNKLHWIPFYEQRIDKCSILYKRINGSLPSYLPDNHLAITYKRHSRNTRYAINLNAICLKYKGETEGGRTFADHYPLQNSGTMYPDLLEQPA